jgi:hypothetical protein
VQAQEAWSPDRSQIVDDAMAFSPWQGIVAHQPLGIIGRARRHVYPILAAYRGELNGCPIHENRAPPDFDSAASPGSHGAAVAVTHGVDKIPETLELPYEQD